MIIWSGIGPNDLGENSGGTYDPAGDSWTTTTTTGAPLWRYLSSSIWTGSKMVVWGGDGPSDGYLNIETDRLGRPEWGLDLPEHGRTVRSRD
jgi:hypothetical protein